MLGPPLPFALMKESMSSKKGIFIKLPHVPSFSSHPKKEGSKRDFIHIPLPLIVKQGDSKKILVAHFS